MEKRNSNNAQENKDLIGKFFELFEKGRTDEIKNLLADTYHLQFPVNSQALNREQGLEIMKAYQTAFPDIKFNFDFQLSDGEYVISRFKATGTQKGEFQGMPATNKKATITGTVIQRVVNSKIVEEIVEMDSLGLIQQLGGMQTQTKLAANAVTASY